MKKASVFAFFLLLIFALSGWAWWGMSDFFLSLSTQVLATAIILASLRVLVGMGGVISFGHALYVGAGAYGAVHLMLWAQSLGFFAPLFLVPLFGGVIGLLVAVFAGWLSTRRSHPIYMAMVTLALCELVHALAQVWPVVFGGEAGLQVDRTIGNVLGLNFADERLMFILALCYAALSLYLMYRLTHTPLGQWLQATREDAVRVACLGMSPQRIQYAAFLISGFFAGIGGALLMLELEAAEPGMFSVVRSGSFLMFTYLGGLGHVLGSCIGAVMQVLGTIWMPSLTPASELYLGLIFIYAVLYWPQGIAGVFGATFRVWKKQWALRHAALYVGCLMSRIITLVCAVELIYRVWDPFTQQMLIQGLLANAAWLIAFIISFVIALRLRHMRRQWRCPTVMREENA